MVYIKKTKFTFMIQAGADGGGIMKESETLGYSARGM